MPNLHKAPRTPKPPKPPKVKTVAQRTTEATRRLQESLGVDDLKTLNAAIAEVAASEVDSNTLFKSKVLAAYNDLASLPKPTTSRAKASTSNQIDLIPLPGTEGIRVDPFGSVDPFLLLRLYGPGQLRKALSGFSYSTLKEAALVVKTRHPDSAPANGRDADSLLDYIIERLAPGN